MTKFRVLLTAVLLAVLLPGAGAFGSTTIPNTFGQRPHATTYNGALYLFHGRQYMTTYGAEWSPEGSVPVPSARLTGFSSIRPIEFNGRLYAFWVDYDTAEFYYMSMDQYGVWSPIVSKIPGATGINGVGLAVFNNRLYAMWRATIHNTSLFYASMGTNGIWSSTARLSTGESSDEPTANVLVGSDGVSRLYAFWKDRNDFGGDQMWYASMTPGSTWSATSKLDTPDYPLTDTNPSLASSGSRLYLTYAGGYDTAVLVKQMDANRTWYQEQTVASGQHGAPSAVWFNGALWVFWPTYEEIQYQVFNF